LGLVEKLYNILTSHKSISKGGNTSIINECVIAYLEIIKIIIHKKYVKVILQVYLGFIMFSKKIFLCYYIIIN
jgi:hypothetical protein